MGPTPSPTDTGYVLYVRKSGMDSNNDCLNISDPCLTIDYALSTLQNPQSAIIDIGNGKFDMNTSLHYDDEQITISGKGPSLSILNYINPTETMIECRWKKCWIGLEHLSVSNAAPTMAPTMEPTPEPTVDTTGYPCGHNTYCYIMDVEAATAGNGWSSTQNISIQHSDAGNYTIKVLFNMTPGACLGDIDLEFEKGDYDGIGEYIRVFRDNGNMVANCAGNQYSAISPAECNTFDDTCVSGAFIGVFSSADNYTLTIEIPENVTAVCPSGYSLNAVLTVHCGPPFRRRMQEVNFTRYGRYYGPTAQIIAYNGGTVSLDNVIFDGDYDVGVKYWSFQGDTTGIFNNVVIRNYDSAIILQFTNGPKVEFRDCLFQQNFVDPDNVNLPFPISIIADCGFCSVANA